MVISVPLACLTRLTTGLELENGFVIINLDIFQNHTAPISLFLCLYSYATPN
jgi:hypothetical protein